MSRFHTPIPIDVEAIKALLPQRGLHIHGVLVTQDPEQKDVKVVVDWESGELRTPYTFPVEFSVEDLRGKKLPKGVTFVEKVAAPKAPAGDQKPESENRKSKIEKGTATKPKTKAPAK
jgi:hypothetical protein